MINTLTDKQMEMQIDAQDTIDLHNKLHDFEQYSLYSGLMMFFLLLVGLSMQATSQEAVTVNIDSFHRIGVFFIFTGLASMVAFILCVISYKSTRQKLDTLKENSK